MLSEAKHLRAQRETLPLRGVYPERSEGLRAAATALRVTYVTLNMLNLAQTCLGRENYVVRGPTEGNRRGGFHLHKV